MSIFKETENSAESNAPANSTDQYQIEAIQASVKTGANWFYWIAALSIINSMVSLFGGQFNFILGLAATQFIDGLLMALSGSRGGFNGFSLIALMLDILVAGVFVLFGYFGGKGNVALFIVGVALYTLDGIIYLLVGDFLAVGFHVFALFFMIKGLVAAFELRTAIKNAPMVQS